MMTSARSRSIPTRQVLVVNWIDKVAQIESSSSSGYAAASGSMLFDYEGIASGDCTPLAPVSEKVILNTRPSCGSNVDLWHALLYKDELLSHDHHFDSSFPGISCCCGPTPLVECDSEVFSRQTTIQPCQTQLQIVKRLKKHLL